MMCIPKTAVALLLIPLLLSGCTSSGTTPSELPDRNTLAVSALFQAENGEVLQGSVAQFSAQETSYPLNSGGAIRARGLPRSGELLLTLFDQQQEVQGTMTLSFSEGAVMDATTGEDGVGHITVRTDTDEVALLFDIGESGALTCVLWLNQSEPSEAGALQKGAEYGALSAGY